MLEDVISRLEQCYAQRDHEIILVNDCSPDDTWEKIEHLCDQHPRVKGVDLAKNFGQHCAILAGLHEAQGDIIICLDDDGQTPPEEAYKLIQAVEADGHDIAIARYEIKQHSAFRNFGSRVNDKMACSLIGKPKDLFLSSFVAFKRFVRDQICQYTFPYPYISGMLLRTTKDIVNIDVDHRERQEGNSGYTLSKLLALWFNGFTNFSIKPLRIVTFLGAIIALIGFILGVYSIVTKVINPATPLGWASTFTATVFIGGLILLVLGLIGEYIGRMFMGLNQQPQFVVRRKRNSDSQP